MFNQTFKKSLVLLFSVVLISLTACNKPNPPTIACSVPELTTAIYDANLNPDHDQIILPNDCDFELGEAVYEIPDPEENTDYEYAGLPSITSPITITGNGSRIFRSDIPGTAQFRIFYIGSTGSLALVDLSLEGGSVNGFGGAVLVDGGTITLTQCTLKGNSALINGGAITSFKDSSELVLVNSVLSDNTAGDGGAIYQEDGLLDIDFESLFEGNQAIQGSGGAIDSNGGILNIYNSTIRGNQSASQGGGLRFSPNETTVQGVMIENNHAPVGGGVYGESGTIKIKDSHIRQNQANWGGGLYLRSGENYRHPIINVEGSIFEDNIADEYGGGVLIDYDASVNFKDCTIINNQSGMFGGGIGLGLNIIEPGVLMTNCTVSGNTTTHLGGGIHISVGEWEIHNSTISGNTANDGGGIFNGGILRVYNSTISGNQAVHGGGVYHTYTRPAKFSFVTVAENTADYGGGLGDFGSGIQITNSLVALNTSQNCQGNIMPIGKNLEDDGSCGFDINENPLLEPLGDNGGPTYTHAIPSFSPAAEVAAPCTALSFTGSMSIDQRGETRPQGAGCDLGAYEAVLTALPIPPMPSPCVYQAIKNSNCRESDHGEAPIVAILMKDETAELVALNPENTYGKFELPSGEGCWIFLNLMSAMDPDEECEVPVENPPEPEQPEELVCKKNLGKNACKERGGKWIEPATEAPYCSCP